MDAESPSVAVPQIVITEPSPMVKTNPVVSIAERGAPALKETTELIHDPVQNEVHQCEQEQPSTDSSQEMNSSGEFAPAHDCVVTVPDTEQSVEVSSADPSEPDRAEDFRTSPSTTQCCPFGVLCDACMMRYGRLWDILDHRFRLPFWILLFALPLSAGVMSSLYMFSCPAAHMLPSALFVLGVSLMALITIRICIILHRVNCEENNSRHALYTLLLISTFITVVFLLTESTIFWQMEWTSDPGAGKYCDTTFVEFTFWWNCASYVALLPLFCFPA